MHLLTSGWSLAFRLPLRLSRSRYGFQASGMDDIQAVSFHISCGALQGANDWLPGRWTCLTMGTLYGALSASFGIPHSS